jgi:hypothetical protein
MAEPVPVLPEQQQPRETLNYRPVSGLAIAALVVAVVYSAIVSVVAVIAFSSGTPVFLPGTLVFPLLAAILAVAAFLQIRAAEGTRSGLALAKWAWWLSIFFGIGYLAVYGGTLMAVCWQADADIGRYFFDKIRAGKVDDAFQFTIDPEERDAATRREEMMIRFGQATGGKKSLLAQFRESDLVQIIRRGGEESKISSPGLKELPEYKEKGYTVRLTYRITTPEGLFDLDMSVRSRESREFKGRRWQLLWGQANSFVASRQIKPYGDKIEDWRQKSKLFAMGWMINRQMDNTLAVFLDSRDPPDRARLERQYQLNRLATTLAVAGGVMAEGGPGLAATRFLPLLNSKLECQLYLPSFHEFAASNFVDAQEFEAPKSIKAAMLARIKESLFQPTGAQMRPQDDNGILERSESEPHHLVVNHNVELAIFEPGNMFIPKYRGHAALVVESDQDPMTSEAMPRWRMVGLKLFAGGLFSAGGSRGMPGMAGMPGM